MAAEAKILSVSWNQDQGCFACGMSNGFRIFNTDPVKLKRFRAFEGGIGLVEMLFRCNFVALVGGGHEPKSPKNHLLVWEDQAKKCVIDLNFRNDVLAVRLRRDRIVAVLEAQVQVYTFMHSPQRLSIYDTAPNPRGLCALSPHRTNATLALPGKEPGQVQLLDLSDASRPPLIVPAHETALACIAINNEGTRIATASEKGTLVRVFDCATGKKLHEVRRGSDKARINCINFNADSTMICVSSDKGTVHVFDLVEEDKRSSIVPKYFSSQWSFAKFTVAAPDTICAFTSSGAVVAAGTDGMWYRFEMSKDHAGTLETKRFLDDTSPDETASAADDG